MFRTASCVILLLPAAALGVPVEKDNLPEAKIDVFWAARSVTLFVPGHDVPTAGIWNRDTQITLSRAQTKAIFDRLERARFDRMPATYGGIAQRRTGVPAVSRPEMMVGSVSVATAARSHAVTQLGEGEQSEELAAMAKDILAVCEAAAKNGVKARDLDDGLQKIQSKQLLPQTVRLLVHRLPEGGKGEAFLMRLEGRAVTSQERTDKGYGPMRRLDLADKDLADLLQVLIDNKAGELPINCWAEHYTDFVVGVLNHEKNMQARQFANMTPQTHGEKQKHFDAIYAAMAELHRRVLRDGQPVAGK
jgi:hypothetical protein